MRPNASRDNGWYEGMLSMTPAELDNLTRQMAIPYRLQSQYLRHLTRGRDLVDIGCGVGMFLNEARRDWNAYGLEESLHGREFAQKRLGLCVAETLNELPVQRFDIVRLSHVIEHIPEPRDFLSWVFEILNPGGVLAIITPNREPLVYWTWNLMMRLKSARPSLKTAIYPDMHVLGFSPCALADMVIRAGLEPLSVSTISMGNSMYYPLFYDGLLAIKPLAQIQRRTLVKYYLPLVLANLGNRFGLGEWIIGYFRKPRGPAGS